MLAWFALQYWMSAAKAYLWVSFVALGWHDCVSSLQCGCHVIAALSRSGFASDVLSCSLLVVLRVLGALHGADIIAPLHTRRRGHYGRQRILTVLENVRMHLATAKALGGAAVAHLGEVKVAGVDVITRRTTPVASTRGVEAVPVDMVDSTLRAVHHYSVVRRDVTCVRVTDAERSPLCETTDSSGYLCSYSWSAAVIASGQREARKAETDEE